MKKLLTLSCLVSLLYSCTPLQQMTTGPSYPQGQGPQTQQVQKLEQTDFYLSDTGVAYVLDMVKMDISKSQSRRYTPGQIRNVLESYVGETVEIAGLPGNRLEVVSAPKVQSYDFYIRNGKVTFKSLYQGQYIAEVYNGLTYVGTIKIKNMLKYKFTERENYDIISRGYESKDLKLVKDGISLYRISFPGGTRDKELSYMLIELASGAGNTGLVKDEMKYLKSMYQLDEKDKVKLLQIDEKVKGQSFTVDEYYLGYDRNNTYLNNYIKDLIERKQSASQGEIEFLEKMYADTTNSKLAELIGNLYLKNGNVTKSNYYLGISSGASLGFGFPGSYPTEPINPSPMDTNVNKSTQINREPTGVVSLGGDSSAQFNKNFEDGKKALNQESYEESIVFFEKAKSQAQNDERAKLSFYMGKAYYMLGNYNLAKSNLLGVTDGDSNLPEAYYYLGVISHKEGNIGKAKEYLDKVRINYPSSTWGRKSSIYLMKL